MKFRVMGGVFLMACAAIVTTAALADDLKSGPDKRSGGAFDVKAITGDQKGKQLCYV